jgi:hypothetical protein
MRHIFVSTVCECLFSISESNNIQHIFSLEPYDVGRREPVDLPDQVPRHRLQGEAARVRGKLDRVLAQDGTRIGAQDCR